MVQISGIPWISIRRVAIVTLVLLTLYSISVSRKERQTISSLLSGQYWLSVCVIGFLCMAFTSIFFTSSPTLSITQFVEMLLNWYLPFFACLLVVGSERNLIVLYKTVAVLSLFVAALGVLDFITRHNWAVEIIPTPLLMKMIQDNPSVADIVYANPIRNGSYRASSIYNVPLSYGEFACMIAPIGLYFIFHARKASEFALGILVLVGSMLSIYVSGSRGASVAFLISAPLFVGLWVIRYSASHPRSTVGPLFATAAGMAVAGLFAVIFTSKKVSNVVFGGGDTRASNDARQEQWLLGWPHIVENPLTGHGFGTAADVVGYYTPANALTIDSYALSLLVETGVPGFVFYFGAIAIAAILLIRVYLTDKDRGAEISAPVACSLIAYGFYRIALSQRENQTLFFIFLATAFVITRESAKRFAKKTKTVERAIDTR
jgi:O-antigen ligase